MDFHQEYMNYVLLLPFIFPLKNKVKPVVYCRAGMHLQSLTL